MATAFLVVSACAWMRQRHFATFFRLHIGLVLVTSVGTLLHGYGSAFHEGIMPISLPGVLLWVLDLVLRAFFLNGASLPSLIAFPLANELDFG
jgi:hypothetical protein